MLRKICFVCNGNNSRSIMAEYIARHTWKDNIEVYSCGINADNTKYVCNNTQTVLQEIGIDLTGRKRCRISNKFMGDEYYYFALDNMVMEKLINEYGICQGRVSILGSGIRDPRGCEIEIYRECRNEIENAINRIDLKNILNDFINQKDYWNNVSNTKQFTTPFQLSVFQHYVSPSMKILDVGCGYGRTLNELYNMGYRDLTGTDFSHGMIARGKSQYPYLNLIVKENESLDFPDEQFDAVILFAVLTCIFSEDEQRKLISEIRRVLKSNGILYINDFLINTDERNISRYQKYVDKYGTYGVFELSEGAVLRHHSKEYIKQLTTSFKQREFEPLIFTTMNGHKSNGFYYIGEKV